MSNLSIVSQYLNSAFYMKDLRATRSVWQAPGVLGTAGVYIFLSYIAVPQLISVRSATGRSRGSIMKINLENNKEKIFLERAVGIGTMGIRDERVREEISRLHENHRSFIGMKEEYMKYISLVIVLSPLRVWSYKGATLSSEAYARYWRYMKYFLFMCGTELKEEQEAITFCEKFTDEYAGSSKTGIAMLETLREVYGKYLNSAIEISFPAVQKAIRSML